MTPDALALLFFVLLHGPEGHEIRVNPDQVTSLRSAVPGTANKYVTNEARCMVGLADGKFVSVIEPCETVQKLLEKAQ